MTKYLKKCNKCQKYGLENPESKCQYCGGKLINPNPPKYSPIDKYQKYRLDFFKTEFKKKFMLD
ncbi:MAG: ribosome biogenesis protein [Candidatus Lokiarchaeota archaeon]|nr:ribosome biogenesis protein [Candidatus Lokiarchaeota archaeon]